jgi:isochorismate synthase EntC
MACYEKWALIFPALITEPLLETTSRDDFEREIEGIRTEIASGHLEKAVAARVKSSQIEMDADAVWRVFEQLHHAHPSAFLFLIVHPEWGCWMGATPENLLTVEGGVGKVMALAGTLTAVQSGWTDKERLEQTVTSRLIGGVGDGEYQTFGIGMAIWGCIASTLALVREIASYPSGGRISSAVGVRVA